MGSTDISLPLPLLDYYRLRLLLHEADCATWPSIPTMAGLKTIILLSFILAIGFLLVILSSALFKDYLTLLVVATYVVAPIPNWICGKAQNQDDFMDSGSNGIVELGRFMTGFLVVMGIGKILHMPDHQSYS